MSAQDRSARIMPEKAFVTGKMAEKRIALPIGRVPGYIPSTHLGMHFTSISRIMREKRKMLKK